MTAGSYGLNHALARKMEHVFIRKGILVVPSIRRQRASQWKFPRFLVYAAAHGMRGDPHPSSA